MIISVLSNVLIMYSMRCIIKSNRDMNVDYVIIHYSIVFNVYIVQIC